MDAPPATTAEETETPCYTTSAAYWSSVEPTMDAMLGGLSEVHRIDIRDSEHFLKTLFKLPKPPARTSCLELGAGIGRVTKNLLARFFSSVTLVEQDSKFIDEAKSTLDGVKGANVQYICKGLQEYEPNPDEKFDMIWIQWVLNYLTDEDLVRLLKACRSSLAPSGLLVIKENCTKATVKEQIYDEGDSSITRPIPQFLKAFDDAGLRVITRTKQKDFPKELFPVWAFALVPKT